MKTISIIGLSLLLSAWCCAQNPVSVRSTNGVGVGLSLSGAGASNALTVSPTNIYFDLAGTVSTTNGQNKWSVSSSNVLANMHIGDNIIISNTFQQYRIVQFLGPIAGGQSPLDALGFVTLQNAVQTMLNSNIQIYPNAVNFTDINQNPQASIGNDASVGVLGEFFANSGKVLLDNGSNTWFLDGYQAGPDSGLGITISQMNIAPIFWIENGTPYNGMGMFKDNEFYLGGSGAGSGTITNVTGGVIKFPTGVSGNGSLLTSLAAANLTGTIGAAQITNNSFAATLAPTFSAANLTSIPAPSTIPYSSLVTNGLTINTTTVTTNVGGGAGTVVFVGSTNDYCMEVSWNPAAATTGGDAFFTVTFGTAMATTNYNVQITGEGAGASSLGFSIGPYVAINKLTTGFGVTGDASASVSPSTKPVLFQINVFKR